MSVRAHREMGDMYSDSSNSSEGDDDDHDEEYPQLNPDLSFPGAEKEKINILVTGFGPFGEHKVNASWEAVKALQKRGIAHNVNLIVHEIPVDYVTVQNIIPKLWEQHKPKMVVHVGVSHLATELTFEKIAHNEGYKRVDVSGKTAPSQCYINGGVECLKTSLNIEKLCCDVNEGSCLVMAKESDDAGRYLCEYTFYASLLQDQRCVSFIHVPMLNQPYTANELGHGLQVAILGMMQQLQMYHPLSLPPDHWMKNSQGKDL